MDKLVYRLYEAEEPKSQVNEEVKVEWDTKQTFFMSTE